ncbi:MAG: hypothetical protein II167_01910 [Clostridiales bacterium]|nr:hypothetical protein [Clostridiales bacterium]
MLSTYLYRVRKSLIHSPLNLVLITLAVGLSVLMVAIPMMESGEDAIVVSDTIKVGGINLLLTAISAFMFYTGLFSGVTGYSFADVNFHLAGPFTEKFNLIIAAVASFKISFVFLFVLSCQSAVIYMALGIRGLAFVLLLAGAFVAMLLSYVLGAFLGAVTCNNEKLRKIIAIVSGCVIGFFAGASVINAVLNEGSISAFRALGTRDMVGEVGSSVFFQMMPVAGWVGMICNGILIEDMIFVVLGSLLSAGTLAIMIMLYANQDFDYYETAMEGAQRISDMKAARRAGVDADSANINRKIKVGKETLTRGWGAGAFGARHQLENARSTRFFFINKLALLYRFMCLIYTMIIARDADNVSSALVPAMTMLILMDLIVYGGGKTILEFNRPFIFLVPEKSSAKIFSCLKGDFAEMIFDSLMCVAVLASVAGFDIPILVTGFALCFVMAVICQLAALICLRIFKNLGRYALMFVRYFFIIFVLMVILIPGLIIGSYVLDGGIAMGFIVSAGIGAVLAGLLLLLSSNIIDKLELNT